MISADTKIEKTSKIDFKLRCITRLNFPNNFQGCGFFPRWPLPTGSLQVSHKMSKIVADFRSFPQNAIANSQYAFSISAVTEPHRADCPVAMPIPRMSRCISDSIYVQTAFSGCFFVVTLFGWLLGVGVVLCCLHGFVVMRVTNSYSKISNQM